MSMSLKNNTNPEFENLFSFISKEEEIEHEAKMLMFHFLDKIQEKADEKELNRKDLAQKIGTSASYITQLFRGDKLINLTSLAKFQKELGFKFTISIENEKPFSLKEGNIAKYLRRIVKDSKGDYLMLIRNRNNKKNTLDYSKIIQSEDKIVA